MYVAGFANKHDIQFHFELWNIIGLRLASARLECQRCSCYFLCVLLCRVYCLWCGHQEIIVDLLAAS